jgi:hypothetical protein
MMYHPPNATTAEAAALFGNADDFEFVRLLNIGTTPVDLEGVRFVEGIGFDFASGPIRYLPAGRSILVVANLGAFHFRYGHAMDASIAGVYTGNLANSGEAVQLADTNGLPIRAFTYSDDVPWPVAADGDGPSLVLREPRMNPDHADPANWTHSAMPGGLPSGVAPAQTFQRWRELTWSTLNATNNLVLGTLADPDLDGLVNLMEYALGLDPRHASPKPGIEVSVEEISEAPRLVLTLRVAPGAVNAGLTWEKSSDLAGWSDATAELEKLDSVMASDGSARVRYADTEPLTAAAGKFIRLRVVLLP